MDIVAIVAPINLQQQILEVAGDKPVIFAKNDRVRVNVPEGEEQFEFIFAGWERLVEVKVVTEPFLDYLYFQDKFEVNLARGNVFG